MADHAYFIDWFPNKPVRLDEQTVYKIGRGGGNEFYLPDYHASRVHAQISWVDDHYELRDLGSSNGTFVNGEQVTERVLQAGDEIQIGQHILKLRVEDDEKVEEEYQRQSKEVQEWQTVIGLPAGEGGLSGTIQDVEISQIVQILESGHKSGRLFITHIGATGSVWFDGGRVVGADYTPDGGETLNDHDAVYTLLSLHEGIFEFLNEPIPFEPRMNEAAQSLLMEALRRLDENRRDDSSSNETVRR